MIDFIPRDDAIKAMHKQCNFLSDPYYEARRHGIGECIEIIKDIPAADVRPVVRGGG